MIKFTPEKQEIKKDRHFGDKEPKWVYINEPLRDFLFPSYNAALLAIDEYIRKIKEPKEVIHDLPQFTQQID